MCHRLRYLSFCNTDLTLLTPSERTLAANFYSTKSWHTLVVATNLGRTDSRHHPSTKSVVDRADNGGYAITDLSDIFDKTNGCHCRCLNGLPSCVVVPLILRNQRDFIYHWRSKCLVSQPLTTRADYILRPVHDEAKVLIGQRRVMSVSELDFNACASSA